MAAIGGMFQLGDRSLHSCKWQISRPSFSTIWGMWSPHFALDIRLVEASGFFLAVTVDSRDACIRKP